MPPSPPPPLDPTVVALLRTTEFGPPPSGAKGRVRNQLQLAGVVGAMRQSADALATSTVPHASRAPQNSAWRTLFERARSWRGLLAGQGALTLLVGMAMATAATLLSLHRRPTLQAAQRVRQEEIVRSLPNTFLDTVVRDRLHAAPAVSAPPLVEPRPAASSLKRSGVVETLGYEQRLLARARAALGRGELDAATQELDRHARLFANGNLKEEREALRIVTLAQQGNLTTARERAARFRRAYPRSIQMSTVDGAVAERP
jgi:hypothetical protein